MGLVPRSPDHANPEGPQISDLRLRGPADVVDWASRDATLGWATWPDVFHLDADGAMQCNSRASSFDSIRRWADDPWGLHQSRREGLLAGPCPNEWLIVESRQRWRFDGQIITEADAQAFEIVHHELATIGIRLLDVMIFDDEAHWWSMGQLLSGMRIDTPASTWPTPVLRSPVRARGNNAKPSCARTGEAALIADTAHNR